MSRRRAPRRALPWLRCGIADRWPWMGDGAVFCQRRRGHDGSHAVRYSRTSYVTWWSSDQARDDADMRAHWAHYRRLGA